ncbi:MAG: acyltransferase [Planctomycetes bacterium]|nr:acyltransferase [Planctomycetota bacterium]
MVGPARPDESVADRLAYLPALDGLRAIAVLLVMWSHIKPDTPGYPTWLADLRSVVMPGEMGVEIFFVLSGFLITRILLAERRRRQPVRWFLLRRLLRIFPIYYLLIAVMAVVRPGPSLPWCAVYLSNFHFVDHGDVSMMRHTWSLCVEEHFYLLWPLVTAFAPGPWARRIMTFGIMPLAVILAVLACYWFEFGYSVSLVRQGSPFRFFSLGAGCLMAFAESWLRRRPGRSALIGLLLVVAGIASWPVFWFAHAPQLFGFGLPLRYTPALWLVHSGAFAAGVVLSVLAGAFASTVVVRPLQAWLPRSIGRISYGLYLYHFPVYGWLLFPAPSAAAVVLAVSVTFAVAVASYWIIERPLLRFGTRFRRVAGSASLA